MATTTLILKEPKATGSTRIMCMLRDGANFRLKIYTDHSVKPKEWTKTKLVGSSHKNAVQLNSALRLFQNKVLNIYEEAKLKGIKADADYIYEKLMPKNKPETVNNSFWNIWELYLKAKRNSFQSTSLKKFNALANHLKEFEKHTRKSLQIDSINGSTLQALESYFFEQKKLSTETVYKYVGNLKMVLNWAERFNLTENSDHKQFSAIQPQDTLKVIYTKEDLQKIRSLNLSQKPYLENIRSLVILSVATGLRYSDFSSISSEHLKKDEDGTPILRKRQIKTGDFVELPLTPEALDIVKKLFTKEVHEISNQKMNKYVKELCLLAGLDEVFEVHTFIGKAKTTNLLPKHQLVSTHTARRTFATNLLMANIPAETVMEFTGHRDYKSFIKYVNIPKKAKMATVKNALLQL
jgi:integrase